MYRLKFLLFLFLPTLILMVCPCCMSVKKHRERIDEKAYRTLEQAQQQVLGRTEPICVEGPRDTLRRRLLLEQFLPHVGPVSLGLHDLPEGKDWDPTIHLSQETKEIPPWETEETLRISILQAIQIGARNARSFRSAQEDLFRSALTLDLEREAFRNTFAGLVSGLWDSDLTGEEAVGGFTQTNELSATRKLKSGLEFSLNVALDLVKIITQDRSSSLGIFADASISIPLLRGAGREIVREPLTQAERDVLYAVYAYERFKKSFAVQVASEYLSVLREEQQVLNAEQNYKRLISATRRARRLADSGKIPEFQFDQAIQDELRARTRWIESRQSHASRLDEFKVLLGLSPDSRVILDPQELDLLKEKLRGLTAMGKVADYEQGVPSADEEVILEEPKSEHAGPWEMDSGSALDLALENRSDLLTALFEVEDAQRKLRVAADGLRAEFNLLGRARAGERRAIGGATQDHARLDPSQGSYSALLDLNLPLERTRERVAYRDSLIALERAVRKAQEVEDQVKLQVLNGLRGLLKARENLQIQMQAVELARQRVRSTDLFLQAGRAEIRDVLEAEEALLSAQNGVASALVSYRVSELELQRDMDILEVDSQGLWKESIPGGE